MSEERLQEIKDSVSFQKEILLAHNMDTLCTDEEEELIEEIERLNNIIKYLEQYFSEREYYEFAQLVRETKQANIEWLKNAIKEEK